MPAQGFGAGIQGFGGGGGDGGFLPGDVLCAADGTDGAPGIAYDAEKATGFYRIATGRVGLSPSGVPGTIVAQRVQSNHPDTSTRWVLRNFVGLSLVSDLVLRWVSGSSDATANQDVALTRQGPGVVAVTTGGIDALGNEASLQALAVRGRDATTDAAVQDLTLRAASALPAAVTNQDGADVVVRPGANATGGGSDGVLEIRHPDEGAGHTLRLSHDATNADIRSGLGLINLRAAAAGGVRVYTSTTTHEYSLSSTGVNAQDTLEWQLGVDGSGWQVASDVALVWSSTTAYTGAKDLGLARSAAGVLDVTDGSTGLGVLRATALDRTAGALDLRTASVNRLRVGTAGVQVGAGPVTYGTAIGTAEDVAMRRQGPGVLQVDSGSAGARRDLLVRDSIVERKVDFGFGGPQVTFGTGTPEGAVTAAVGSLFLRDDGAASTTLYVKESGTGNTGWVAK